MYVPYVAIVYSYYRSGSYRCTIDSQILARVSFGVVANPIPVAILKSFVRCHKFSGVDLKAFSLF